MSQPPTTPATAPPAQAWSAEAYAANGRFVADLATAVIDLLAPQPGERILDLGCGDGALTAQLAATGAIVTGVDASPSMIAAARARGLDVHLAEATALPFENQFDAVFSNAALHWIPQQDQPAALASIHRALRAAGPPARFVAEMGGLGNVAAIRTALRATLAPFSIDSEAAAASFYPSPAQYQGLLEQAGFTVHAIHLIPRPTALPGGPDGMAVWLNTFRNGVLDRLPTPARSDALEQIVRTLAPILQDPLTGHWTADYVRLRFHATRA